MSFKNHNGFPYLDSDDQPPHEDGFGKTVIELKDAPLNGLHDIVKEKPDADEDDFPPYVDEEITGCMRHVEKVQLAAGHFIEKHSVYINYAIIGVILIGYHVYLGFALAHDFSKAETLMVLTIFAWVLVLYYKVLVPLLTGKTHVVTDPINELFNYAWNFIVFRMGLYGLIAAAIAVFLIFDTANDRKRLIGLSAMAFLILLMFALSHARSKINWRPVIWGYLMQFVIGLLVLRWEWGETKFHQVSNLTVTFLDFTNNGSEFVYGFLAAPPKICGMDPVFAFSSIQVVVYFGSIVALLYYYGIMQVVLKKMAWAMQVTLGTTATESLNACACIFLGQSEAPLLIKPYVSRMTASELHAVMTSGFACIAGSLFAAYIAFGACPKYLLSATVMSAPGSLACSKILFPETEKSQLTKVEDLELPAGAETNALECISNGAIAAVELVVAIVANLLVFLALLAFLDNVLGYLGELVGQNGWSLEFFLGYLLFPLAYIMGVTENSDETMRVASLMGTKTALNEFIAYQKLGKLVQDGLLSPRASMIATYALCGFSNFSSIGIQLGVLGGMAPERKPLLAKLAMRALLAGCISCFMTASLAGVLVDTPQACSGLVSSGPCFDVGDFTQLQKELGSLSTTTVSTTTATHLGLRQEL
ncbi:sodium/nucleoside cotransporter 2 [Aphelenchoides avenae]|nr:sodium/nucleoside cotransporter 2 [Aphelenchus avenae]